MESIAQVTKGILTFSLWMLVPFLLVSFTDRPRSSRHRATVWDFLRENLRTTISWADGAERAATLLILTFSGFLALTSSLNSGNLRNSWDAWEDRVFVGVGVFIIAQFFVLTPVRMWWKLRWITNVEEICLAIGTLRKEGAALLNERPDASEVVGNDAENDWAEDWKRRYRIWESETIAAVALLSPVEGTLFETIGTHDMHLSSRVPWVGQLDLNLAERLERIRDILHRWQD